MNKADYVLEQARRGNASGHHCHWPGCGRAVPPALWGCRRHWFMLPKQLRDRIWQHYSPGQEITKTPSAEYVQVALEVREWIKLHHPSTSPQPSPRSGEGELKLGK